MKPPTDAKWVKGDKGEGLSIVYFDKEGNKLIRRKDPTPKSLKGSKAWRHNNPGNLAIGPHARQLKKWKTMKAGIPGLGLMAKTIHPLKKLVELK